jgi:hypothetical protein
MTLAALSMSCAAPAPLAGATLEVGTHAWGVTDPAGYLSLAEQGELPMILGPQGLAMFVVALRAAEAPSGLAEIEVRLHSAEIAAEARFATQGSLGPDGTWYAMNLVVTTAALASELPAPELQPVIEVGVDLLDAEGRRLSADATVHLGSRSWFEQCYEPAPAETGAVEACQAGLETTDLLTVDLAAELRGPWVGLAPDGPVVVWGEAGVTRLRTPDGALESWPDLEPHDALPGEASLVLGRRAGQWVVATASSVVAVAGLTADDLPRLTRGDDTRVLVARQGVLWEWPISGLDGPPAPAGSLVDASATLRASAVEARTLVVSSHVPARRACPAYHALQTFPAAGTGLTASLGRQGDGSSALVPVSFGFAQIDVALSTPSWKLIAHFVDLEAGGIGATAKVLVPADLPSPVAWDATWDGRSYILGWRDQAGAIRLTRYCF